MATGKRFYWIKLKDSFLTSDTVDYFMSLPDGANYVVLYQLLCLRTINTNGRLCRQIGEVIIPYDVEKIRRDCKWFSADTIRVAMDLFKMFGLIYEDVDGVLRMTKHEELVGSETDYAVQKRLSRSSENALECANVDNGVDNVHIDIRDKDIRDIYNNNINAQNECANGGKSAENECATGSKCVDNATGYGAQFEKVWNSYPRKKDKARAYKAYKARVHDGWTEKELFDAVIAYKNECIKNRTDERYIKLAATFFSVNTPFTDYLKKEEVVEDGGNPFDGYV